MPRPFAFIQARLGSKRFPKKILQTLPFGADREATVLDHIYRRMRTLLPHERVVFLIPKEDHELQTFLSKRGYLFFLGDEENVWSRYQKAAEHFGADSIFRLTGDNPFLDLEAIQCIWEALFYVSQKKFCISVSDLPLGMGLECFSRDALETVPPQGFRSHHLEHVSLHIKEDPDQFFVKKIRPSFLLREEYAWSSRIRLTLDEEKDWNVLQRVNQLYLDNPLFGARDVIQNYQRDPAIFSENQTVEQVRFALPSPTNHQRNSQVYLVYADPKEHGTGHYERCKSLSILLQMQGFFAETTKSLPERHGIWIWDKRDEDPPYENCILIDHEPKEKNQNIPRFNFLPHPRGDGDPFSFYSSPLVELYHQTKPPEKDILVYAGGLSQEESWELDSLLPKPLRRIGGAKPSIDGITWQARVPRMQFYEELSQSTGLVTYFGLSFMEAMYLERPVALYSMSTTHHELALFAAGLYQIPYLGQLCQGNSSFYMPLLAKQKPKRDAEVPLLQILQEKTHAKAL